MKTTSRTISERLRKWNNIDVAFEAANEIERLMACLTEQQRNYEACGIALAASLGENERLRAEIKHLRSSVL